MLPLQKSLFCVVEVAIIAQERAEKERDRTRALRNYEEHKALERRQEEKQQQVRLVARAI